MRWWWLALAGVRVLVQGDTVESVAQELGVPERAAELRALNGLGPDDVVPPGTVIELPPDLPGGDCQPAYVRAITGAGEVWQQGAATSLPLTERMPLAAGSKVCTGEDAYATIRLGVDLDAGTFDEVGLTPGTCMVVRGMWGARDGRVAVLALDRGSVVVLSPEASRGRVVVETRAGVTLGDAGGFRVAVEADATRTEAVGEPVLTMAQGAQVAVPKGFGGRTVVGQTPGAPVALPPSSTLQTPGVGAVLRRAEFSWTPADGGVGYAVEMSPDADFSRIVYKRAVGDADFRPEALALPVRGDGLYWRVTTLDRGGFEGPPSDAWWFLFPSALVSP